MDLEIIAQCKQTIDLITLIFKEGKKYVYFLSPQGGIIFVTRFFCTLSINKRRQILGWAPMQTPIMARSSLEAPSEEK